MVDETPTNDVETPKKRPSRAKKAPIPVPVFQAPDVPAAEPVKKAAAKATKKAAKKTPAKAATKAAATKATKKSAAKDDAAAAPEEQPTVEAPEQSVGEDEDGPRRRRRRGGRGRKKRPEDGDTPETDETNTDDQDGDETSDAGVRKRRRRRGADGDLEPSPDDPPNTVVKVRQPRAKDESLRGSTRLEAKKQRRREGREAGRKRAPILTEAEFLARRESVDRVMAVRNIGDRTQIAVLEDGVLVEHYVTRGAASSMVGNVYVGRVQNVLPSMEAAFVDIGRGRNAVLYAGEVNWDAAGLDGQPKRIEFALKSGDPILVQVTKDPVGQKGARLTSQVSLPGRFLVYVPDGSMTGISRKLPDTERSRLKDILKRVMPEEAGVIVRTAAEGAPEDALERDVSRLKAQWEQIQQATATAQPPTLLYSEPDLAIKVVRDIFNEDVAALHVFGDNAWAEISTYVQSVAPDLADRLHHRSDDVFAEYRVEEQLMKALDRKVYLPSGGSLVIDRTEAMTVVDVNTGKFTGQGGNLEETVTRNNIEAAEEIVRQLRLRDIGGIIVVDFIDMVLESNRDQVLRRLVECLGRDRTKHQVAEVTSLGLVQMTRKRIGSGLIESFSKTCDACNGRGIHVSLHNDVEPVASPKARRPANAVDPADVAAKAREVTDVEEPVTDVAEEDEMGAGLTQADSVS
jgi:ribonuclease E